MTPLNQHLLDRIAKLQLASQQSALELYKPEMLNYVEFKWKETVHNEAVGGYGLHNRLRFETWLMGAYCFTDGALEDELGFLHALAVTIREMSGLAR